MMNHEHEFKILCENVKKLRMKERLSQKEMASLLGIGIYSLKKLENGILPPRLTWRFLLSIHESFGIFPSDMMTENGVCAVENENKSTNSQ